MSRTTPFKFKAPKEWGNVVTLALTIMIIMGGIAYALSVIIEPDYSDAPVEREYFSGGDIWLRVEPEAVGIPLDQARVTDHYLRTQGERYTSFLLVKDNQLFWERYWGGSSSKITTNPTYSVTKAVMGTVVGAAVQTGAIESLDDPISKYIPSRFVDPDDADKGLITIRQLLDMQSGLDWDESVYDITEGEPYYGDQILNLPLIHDPGTTYNFSSVDYHLLSLVVEGATGMETVTFTDQYLFEPLGIVEIQWLRDIEFNALGGTGLRLRAPSMAAIGQLYLNNGYNAGEQIVSEAWVADVMEPSVITRPADNVEGLPELGYSYGWWVRDQGGYQGLIAYGYGGQMIVVLPELDTVMVVTTSTLFPEMLPEAFKDLRMVDFDVIEKYVVPMVLGEDLPPVVEEEG